MKLKRIADLGLSALQETQVLGLLSGEIDPEDNEAVASWIRQCYHRPSDRALLMHALNDVCEMHGVEAIARGNDQDPRFEYLNAGDTYAATLIHNRRTGEIYVGCWGDIIEQGL